MSKNWVGYCPTRYRSERRIVRWRISYLLSVNRNL